MSKKTNAIDKAYEDARRADGAIRYRVTENHPMGKFAKAEKKANGKEQRMKAYRAEARRKVSLANKRIRRLEEKGLTNTPAYKGLVKSGEPRFSVKGKDFNELQAEVSRMDRFIKANTSTLTGVKTTLKNMADITGLKYENTKDLQEKANKFFELASKIEQYLRTVEDMASAIGYQKIWESINTYVEKAKIDLTDTDVAIDEMIDNISKAIVEKESPEHIISNPTDSGETFDTWVKLLD